MSDFDIAAQQATNEGATQELIATIKGLLTKRGDGLLANRRMFLGLMRDHAPDKARAIRLLMAVYDSDAPRRLKVAAPLDNGALTLEARSLSDDTGLREDLARWAIGVWGAAMGAQLSTPPLAAVVAAPTRSVDELTWSTPASPPLQAPQPVTPEAPAPAAPLPSAAPPPPPHVVATAAPVVAQTPLPPPAKASKGGVLRYGSIIVGIVVLVTAANRMGLFSDNAPRAPAEPPASDQPAQPPAEQPAAGPPAPIVVATLQNGTEVLLASPSTNPADWPVMPGANHTNNDPLKWQFTTAIDFPDGRRFFYQAFYQMQPQMIAGVASAVAVDVAKMNGKNNAVSSSKTVVATRRVDPATGSNLLDVRLSDWVNDAAKAPLICVTLNVGTDAKLLDPQAFCAQAAVNGACAPPWLGCGRFR